MPTNDITKLLKFKGIIFLSQEEKENHIILNFEREDMRPLCPSCNSNKMHINDWRIHEAVDLPINNIPVKIRVKKQRYICSLCRKTITGNLENIEYRKQYTSKVIPFIKDKVAFMTFKDCSKELSISPTTAMRLFKKNTSYSAPVEYPKVLHIDEFKGNSNKEKYQLAIINGNTGKVFDILENRKQKTLFDYLKQPMGSPEIVVMDMWEPYYNVVKKLWPETIIVADRFHYLRQVNWCVRDVRLKIQKTHKQGKKLKKYWKLFMMNNNCLTLLQNERLEELLSMDKELMTAYKIKQSFELILSKKDFEAHESFDNWLDTLQNIEMPEVKTLLGTFENWYAEVAASFYYNYTNGIAEGINNKIKVIKRQAYGIRNFDNFRRLIMHRIS